jgi:hypothetical protein
MTIAQQLKVTDFPFFIKDKNGNVIYWETISGYWRKKEYDSNGKEIYCEHSDGSWIKREYDSNGKEIYYENSLGYIEDNRPKAIVEVTLEEIAAKMGISIEQLRIKE